MADDDGQFVIDPNIGVAQRSAQESGLATYANGSAVPTSFNLRVGADYQPMKLLARLDQKEPQTVSLHVRASVDSEPFDFDGMAQFPDLGGVDAIGLVLVIDYGDMTGRHRVVADLRSGTYQLPSITFAQVYALAWAQAGTLNFGFQAAAALSRGTVPNNPKPLTYTGAGTVTAGGSVLVPIPYYAEAADIWANGWAGGIGAPNAPVLRAAEVGLYRDYTTGLFVPPWGPYSLSGDALDTDALTLENGGAADVRCFCQFYLGL